MTKREIEEKANEIVKANNDKYEALKNKDVESYEKLHELEAILILSIQTTQEIGLKATSSGRTITRLYLSSMQ